ncbi:MAG: hypothetical protein ACRDP7_42445 [Trebonia sp.]
MNQATVSVTITDATLTALPEIIHPDQPGYHDAAHPDATEPTNVGHLPRPPIPA